MTYFSNNLKTLLRRFGIPQKQLAKYLRVSQATVSLWVRGERQPTLRHLKEVAECFNISPDYMLREHK